MNTIIDLLQHAGLTEGESKVYMALLSLGSSTTGKIVKSSGVAKSIVYQLLEKLMEKGLVSYVVKEKTKYFQASEPQKILEYLLGKKERQEQIIHELEDQLPKLQSLQLESTQSEARVYTGLRGIATAHSHLYNKLKRGEEYCALGIPAFQPPEMHAHWMRDHRIREKLGITCRFLFNADTQDEVIESRNQTKDCVAKRMPTGIKTPAQIVIFKDTIVIILVKPIYIAVEIVSQEIADSFQSYFDEFWNQSTQVYLGKQGAAHALKQIIEEGKKGNPNYGFGTADNLFVNHLPEELKHFFLMEKKHNIKTKVLFMEGGEHEQPNAQVRYLPREYISPVRIMAAGDKLFIVDFTDPITTIIINKKEIAQAYTKHFNLLWKIAGQKTKLYTGEEGAIRVLNDYLDIAKSGKEVLGFGSDVDDYLRVAPNELNNFVTQAKKHQIKERLLYSKSFNSPNKNAKIRYLPSGFTQPVRTMIYGDKVAIIDFTGEISTVVLDNAQIATAYRKQFEFLWKTAKYT